MASASRCCAVGRHSMNCHPVAIASVWSELNEIETGSSANEKLSSARLNPSPVALMNASLSVQKRKNASCCLSGSIRRSRATSSGLKKCPAMSRPLLRRLSVSTSMPISLPMVTAQATKPRVCERLNLSSGHPAAGSILGLPSFSETKRQSAGGSPPTEASALRTSQWARHRSRDLLGNGNVRLARAPIYLDRYTTARRLRSADRRVSSTKPRPHPTSIRNSCLPLLLVRCVPPSPDRRLRHVVRVSPGVPSGYSQWDRSRRKS
jgi:hypothetical protein